MHFIISVQSAVQKSGLQTSAQMTVGKISTTNTLRLMQTTKTPAMDEDLVRARRKKAAVIELIRKTGRNGRQALGTMQDTPDAREAWALGEAWRKAQTYP